MSNTSKTEREEFLDDVITTALEGGIGYWAMAETYEWSDDGPTTATVFDIEDPIVCRVCEQEVQDARTITEQLVKRPVMLLTEAELESYKVRRGAAEEANEGKFEFAVDHEHEPKTMLIDRALVEKALAIIADPSIDVSWNDGDRQRCVGAAAMNDAGDIDAGDADCIVQVGLFGEVVYG